ncbi:putative Bacterial leucyl aminopeptidase [Candidatus Zixiibacteriota bacterium]|nr:putative Bacterial leucyl aminopeptidase [candidate division Zixibacteria bacterium]
MRRILIFLVLVFGFSFALAHSGDLYLLSIDSPDALRAATKIVPHAHGTLDGRFIVALDLSQAAALRNSGLSPELVASDFNPEDYYLVSELRPGLARKEKPYGAIYVSGGNYIARLTPSELSVVGKEAVTVTLIGSKVTPLFYQPAVIAAQQPADFPMDTLANLIVQDSLYNYDTRLEAFRTRYIYSDSVIPARNWLVNKFRSFGYNINDVYTDTFYFNGYPCNNVICIKPGTTEADRLIVIGAHYDSYNQDSDPLTYAPGADDNASGTAAVLEMARILKNVQLKKTIMFVAFSAEEVGLVGSYVIAQRLYQQGVNVECMLNFDMIGYTADAYPNMNIFSGNFRGYADLLAGAYPRVTDLIPNYAGQASNSDHASFADFGFHVAFVEEGDFNTAGWHTNLDLSTRMDFPYFAKMVKGMAASLGQIDQAASITAIDHLYDVGDGQSIQVTWTTDCRTDYTYKILYGTSSGNYTDTVDVPPLTCAFDVTGLTEGQVYYFSVMGINGDGYGPAYLLEVPGETYINPRVPSGFAADPDSARIDLHWHRNQELDIDHYHILRRDSVSNWSVLKDTWLDTVYADTTAHPHIAYRYAVMAVDHDNNESDTSLVATAVAATFDGGLLFVDETAAGGINPSETKQAAYYDSIMTGVGFTKYSIGTGQQMTRSIAGQYNSIVWVDDDVSGHLFGSSEDSMKWYLNYDVNLFLAGWQTVSWISGSQPLVPGDFPYDYLGLTQVTENTAFDFNGATGVNGWPSVQVGTNNPFGGVLSNVAKFQTLPGAQVIYTYNSQSGNPSFQGQPAGVIYTVGNSTRIALSFPIYYLTEATGQALMSKVAEIFGVSGPAELYGDVNGDKTLNILDVAYLINYLYKSGPAPGNINNADPNHSCTANILDVAYLINYLYKGGPTPLAGCIQ